MDEARTTLRTRCFLCARCFGFSLNAPNISLPSPSSCYFALLAYVQFFNSKALQAKQADMISVEGLNHYFSRRYTREVAEGDESIAASWKRIRHGLHLTLSSTGIDGVTRVKPSEQRELQKVLDSDIPSLRRKAAPVQFSFFGVEKN